MLLLLLFETLFALIARLLLERFFVIVTLVVVILVEKNAHASRESFANPFLFEERDMSRDDAFV